MGHSRSPRFLVWELSDQLNLEVSRLIKEMPVESDSRLRQRINDAASAVSRHIIEALNTERQQDFVRFVRQARAAVKELHDGLRAALLKRALGESDIKNAGELLSQLYPALSSLITVNSRSGTADRSPSSTHPSAGPSRT